MVSKFHPLSDLATELVNISNLHRHHELVSTLIAHLNDITERLKLSLIAAHVSDKPLNCGLAISTSNAASCLEETYRTMKLIMSVYHACLDLLTIESNTNSISNGNRQQPFHILYAGCGPFAPAIIATAILIPPDKVKFILMDVHPESIAIAKQVMKELGINESIHEYVIADASEYQHNKDYNLNGLIVFSFNKGLEREPQLPITSNLSDQLSEPAFLVPETIDFFAHIVEPHEELNSHSPTGSYMDNKRLVFNPEAAMNTRLELGPLLRLNIETAREIKKLKTSVKTDMMLNVNMLTVQIPQNRPVGKNTIMISSRIIFYRNITLEEYESPLTYPTFFIHGQNLGEGTHLTISYVMSSNPGFIHTVHDSDQKQS